MLLYALLNTSITYRICFPSIKELNLSGLNLKSEPEHKYFISNVNYYGLCSLPTKADLFNGCFYCAFLISVLLDEIFDLISLVVGCCFLTVWDDFLHARMMVLI